MIDKEASGLAFRFSSEKKKYIIATAAAAAAMAAGIYLGCFYTGWIGFPGTHEKYFVEQGHIKDDTWVIDADGNYSHTDENGMMVRGIYREGINLYLFSKDGKMQTGWQDTDDGKMYCKKDGKVSTGWETISGNRYHFDKNGIMDTGWLRDGQKSFYLGKDGICAKGWQTIDENRYFFKETGEAASGWMQDGEYWYLFAESGEMLTGDRTVDGRLYHMGKDGKMHVGWYETKEGKRYHEPSGEAAKGWRQVDGDTYFFGDDFLMKTEDITIEGENFHLEEDGTVEPGWHESEDGDFYVCSDGYILDTEEEGGNFGRLVIREAGVNVAVNTAQGRDRYQSIVDDTDSAVAIKERRDTEYVIADRRSQGFVLDNIKEGTPAYVIEEGDVKQYRCIRTCRGTNSGKDVTDEDGRSVWRQNDGGLCTYGSAGTEDPSEIIAVFWEQES